jgi:hypothetical protein
VVIRGDGEKTEVFGDTKKAILNLLLEGSKTAGEILYWIWVATSQLFLYRYILVMIALALWLYAIRFVAASFLCSNASFLRT